MPSELGSPPGSICQRDARRHFFAKELFREKWSRSFLEKHKSVAAEDFHEQAGLLIH
jgi:hypothetical protein